MTRGWLALLVSCGSPPPDPAALREIHLRVDGMACDSCAQRIERALDCAAGVEDATVDFATGTAVVRFDAGRTDAGTIEHMVDELGFDASFER